MLDDLVVHQQSVGDRVGCYLPPGISQKDTEQWLKDNYPEWLPQLYKDVEDVKIPKYQRFTLTTAHLDHNPANCKL